MADDARRRLEAERQDANDLGRRVRKHADILYSQLDRLIPECVQALRELGVKPGHLTPRDKRRTFQRRGKMGWSFAIYTTHIADGDWYFSIQAAEDGTWSWAQRPSDHAQRVVGAIAYNLAHDIEPLWPESRQRESLSDQVTKMART